ncbi:MAG: SDR family oxidoreductase [Algoriphagus sp.]|uniref:SDR family NAD(P)-dependent oxidoreductase n=1 Tax=Algoriphagus sp. TaxID=1872435 RepID=UPI0027304AB8|nr:SDR family oxidoreductase [Algoriphagus sp.]MDP2041777.1 SDR family oxidoreductase [Algoriphagus sp.]MDP3473490.1 SDR family oxidoreductase [Algoriphagus sp.]
MNPNLILITGAGSGIGLHLAAALFDRGFTLLLVDLSTPAIEKKFNGSSAVHVMTGDISKAETWSHAINLAKNLGQPISHLINCAGVIRPGFLADYALADIDFHLDVNTKGTILGTSIIGKEMKFQEFGHIINIASLAGIAPVSGLSLYTASKFAVRGFSLAAAAEFRDFGIFVSVVCPDLVDTPMLTTQLDYPEESKLSFSGPKKVLRPEDITRVILELMENPRVQVCIPETRGFLAKIAGAWPKIGELFRANLESKGRKAIQNRK